MVYYIHGTDSVRKWFGHRMKKNLINKRATFLSSVLCVGGFTLFTYSRRNLLPPVYSYTGMAVGLTALLWSTLISKIKLGYTPLPKVQFEDDIFLDILGDDVLVKIDSETAIDKLVEILSLGDEILSELLLDMKTKKKDLGNIVELMKTGECPAYAEPTTTLYLRMFMEISEVFRKFELDVQVGEFLDYIPIMDNDNRPPHSKNLLKKIENVFLKYMYAVESFRFGFRGHRAPEFIRSNISRARKCRALKVMMRHEVPKRIREGSVELVQFLQENIAERMSDASQSA